MEFEMKEGFTEFEAEKSGIPDMKKVKAASHQREAPPPHSPAQTQAAANNNRQIATAAANKVVGFSEKTASAACNMHMAGRAVRESRTKGRTEVGAIVMWGLTCLL
jgi:hypothetical protein